MKVIVRSVTCASMLMVKWPPNPRPNLSRSPFSQRTRNNEDAAANVISFERMCAHVMCDPNVCLMRMLRFIFKNENTNEHTYVRM